MAAQPSVAGAQGEQDVSAAAAETSPASPATEPAPAEELPVGGEATSPSPEPPAAPQPAPNPTPDQPQAPAPTAAPSAVPVASPAAPSQPAPSVAPVAPQQSAAPAAVVPAVDAPAVDSLVQPLAVVAPLAALSGGFEIDGDLTAGTMSPPGKDWNSVSYGSYDDGFNDSTQIGGKENSPGTWGTESATAPGKADFGLIRWYLDKVGGQQFLNMAFVRADGTGSVYYNVEFNQAKATGIAPTRTVGDFLLGIEQGGNGPFQLISFRIWNGTGWVTQALTGSPVVGETNATTVAGYAPKTFFELGINLTALDLAQGGDTCDRKAFGQIDIRTRTSPSESSELSDRARFEADIPSSCPEFAIEKRNTDGQLVPGATFSLTPNPATGTGSVSITDGGAGDTDGVANGIIVPKVSYVVPITVTETVAPPGYLLPPPSQRTRVVTLAPYEVATVKFTDPRAYQPLTVTKTAAGSFTANHAWSIDKRVDKTQAYVAGNGKATFAYTVDVTQGARTTTTPAISGTIAVTNPNAVPMRATIVDKLGSGTVCTFAATDADSATAGLQVNLPAGVTNLSYTCTGGNPDGDTNQVTVTWDLTRYPQTQAHVDAGAAAGTATATATVAVSYTVTDVNRTVTIEDDRYPFDPAWTITYDRAAGAGKVLTRSYSVDLGAAPGTCETVDNTATIKETGQADNAAVTVCSGADLTVDKNKVLSFDRSYEWNLRKTGPTGRLFADPVTGKVTADYEVTVTPTGHTDSNWAMAGEITVTNPNNWQAVPVTVTDEVSLGAGAVCTVTGVKGAPAAVDADPAAPGFQYVLHRSTTAVFTYSCTFSEQPAYTGSNKAVVTWDAAAANTPNGSSARIVGVAEGDWSQTPANQSVTITDSHHTFDPAWVVKASDGPQTRNYEVTWTVDEPGVCRSFTNTASLTGSDGLGLSDDVTVEVCRAADLTVEKTVRAELDRDWEWNVHKVARGDSPYRTDDNGDVTIGYDVTVTPGAATDSNWGVNGTITIANPNTWQGIAIDAVDELNLGDGGECTVTQALPITVAAGKSLTLDYTCTFTQQPSYDGSNTATVTWDKASAHTANGSATDTAPLATGDWMVNRFNDTVTITDDHFTFDQAWTVGVEDGVQSRFYELVWNVAVDGECQDFTNVAALKGDDGFTDSDDERIKACRGANVTIAETSYSGAFERWNDWSIDKVAEAGPFHADAQGNVTVGYDVTVKPGAQTDEAWSGAGTVVLENPNQFVDIPVTLEVELTTGGDPVCTITGTDLDPATAGFQTVVDAGERVTIAYTCTFGSQPAYSGSAVATVTWDPEIAGSSTDSDWDSASVTPISWEITSKDDTVTVTDDHYPFDPAWVVDLADGESTRSYELTWNVGTAGTCKEFTNVAALEGDDGFEGEDSATVEACRGADLTISKNVIGSFDRSYLWDVEKQGPDGVVYADPTTGKATVGYEVVVTPSGHTDSGWAMSGEITVTNPNDFQAVTATVTDSVDIGGGATCTVTDGVGAVIPASGSVTFDYTCTFTSQPAYTGTNTATVTWDKAAAHTTGGSATGTAAVAETGWEQTPVNQSVTVTDDHFTFDPSWVVNAGDGVQKKSYEVTWTVAEPGTCEVFDNTAALTGSDGLKLDDSATVKVCRAADLTVAKTLTAGLDRTWDWTVEKVAKGEGPYAADPETGDVTVGYDVSVTPGAATDSAWSVEGTIAVANPNDWQDVSVTVADVISLGEAASCTVTGIQGGAGDADPAAPGFQATVPAAGQLVFTYDCSFTGQPAYDGSNKAVVTWDDTASHTATGSAESSVPVVAADWAVNPLNDEVTVTDDHFTFDPEWVVALADGVSKRSYEVTWNVEAAGRCQVFDNEATITGDDGFTDSATASVEACRQADLTGGVSGEGRFLRTYEWSIEKSLGEGQPERVISDGEGNASVDYSVVVDVVGHTDSEWEVNGAIAVQNPNDYTGVRATIGADLGLNGSVCTVDPAADVDPSTEGVQIDLAASGSAEVDFTCTLATLGEAAVSVTATLGWGDGEETVVESEPIEFGFSTFTGHVIVFDDHGDPEGEPSVLDIISAEDAPASYDYTVEYSDLPAECAVVTNTAWVSLAYERAESGVLVSDDAEVTICPPNAPLTLAVDATGNFDREYLWRIAKQVDRTQVTVVPGGSAQFQYVVTATPDGSRDSGHAATGELVLGNPNLEAVGARLDSLTAPAGMECSADEAIGESMTVPAQGEIVLALSCTGTPSEPAAASVEAGISFVDSYGETLTATASAELKFELAGEKNRTVKVYDDLTNPQAARRELGEAEWNADAVATEFRYQLRLTLPVGQARGDFVNTAQIGTDGPKANATVRLVSGVVLPTMAPTPSPKPSPTPSRPGLPSTGADGDQAGGALLPLAGIIVLTGSVMAGRRRGQ